MSDTRTAQQERWAQTIAVIAGLVIASLTVVALVVARGNVA